MAFVLASFLATAGGVVYLLLLGGATPEVTSANFTLTLLVMVVIGGTGTRWGAVLGGVALHAARPASRRRSSSHAVSSLPVGAAHTAAAAAVRARRALHPRRLLRARRARAHRPGCAGPRLDAAAAGGDAAMRIAWEERGAGPAAAADPGARLRPLGLGAGLPGRSPSGTACSGSTTAASASRDKPDGPVHRARRWPTTRCRCSTRPASSARTCSARASAG